MGKRAQTKFERKHGVAEAPKPFFEGTWAPYFMRVEATLTCKLCGTQINLSLKGDPFKCSKAQIGKRIISVAERKHECPAVNAELEAHLDKYFADVKRGMEKKQEADYRRTRGQSSH
ncbi:MAG: hypothetical protein M0R06_03995 [Sphaerochaeta sp.]|jgi:hypothetical protein|nr:hypothetical protein [Sphaerochaeta sp.]